MSSPKNPQSGNKDRVKQFTSASDNVKDQLRSVMKALIPATVRDEMSQTPSLAKLRRIFSSLQLELQYQTSSEEELVESALEKMRSLLPGWHLIIQYRKVNKKVQTLGLKKNRLKGPVTVIQVTENAIKNMGITQEDIQLKSVRVAHDFKDIVDAEIGFDTPIVHGGELWGVIHFYSDESELVPEEHRFVAEQLSFTLGWALHNQKQLKALSTQTKSLEELLNQTQVPVLIMDEQGTIVLANKALLRLTQVSLNEILGRNLFTILSVDEKKKLEPVFEQTLEGKSTTRFEMTFLTKKGEPSRVVFRMDPILSEKNEATGVVAIGRDLTEVNQLQEQVIQAEKLATLGQLVTGVVHELNNPLTSIMVYSEFLLNKFLEEDPDSDTTTRLQRIVKNAVRMQKFTQDLMVYARPSRDTIQYLDMTHILEEALIFCEPIIQKRGVQVEKVLHAEKDQVQVVESQLHQVFINLMTNACHAMPDGAGCLVVRTSNTAQNEIRVDIQDNGAGILEDHLAQIFEPFFTTKGEGKGTGLGLSIVQKIIHQHNGKIEVESEIGSGTTFSVFIPLATKRS